MCTGEVPRPDQRSRLNGARPIRARPERKRWSPGQAQKEQMPNANAAIISAPPQHGSPPTLLLLLSLPCHHCSGWAVVLIGAFQPGGGMRHRRLATRPEKGVGHPPPIPHPSLGFASQGEGPRKVGQWGEIDCESTLTISGQLLH